MKSYANINCYFSSDHGWILMKLGFNLKKRDLFCVPERGKDLGGFPRVTALKVEEKVYMSQKDGGEGTLKVPRIS